MMPSDTSNPEEQNVQAATAELLDKLKTEFPKAPDLSKVWTQACKNAFKREVDQYNSKDEIGGKIPRYFAEIGPLKYLNFVKHVLKNFRQLEQSANSIYLDHERSSCEKRHAEFQIETALKSAVMRAIMGVSKFENFSSDFNSQATKSRRELLMEGGTEVQVILKSTYGRADIPSEKVRTEGYSVGELWKDKWHPINLTMNFDMFQRIVNLILEQRKNPLKELLAGKGHENTYKRHYLKYMFKVAESNQEFLLAVISYGTDVRFFPSKVLESLQARGLLKEEFNAYKSHVPEFKGFTFSMGQHDSIIPKRNAEYLKKFTYPNPLARKVSSSSSSSKKPLIQIVKLVDLTDDADLDNDVTEGSKKENDQRKSSGQSSSARPSTSGSSRDRPSTSGFGGSSKPTNNSSGGSKISSSRSTAKSGSSGTNQIRKTTTDGPSSLVRTVTQEVKVKNPGNMDDKGKTVAVTEEIFRESTRKLWQMFFEPGFNLSPSVASVWYQGYLNHVKAHKDQINNCLSTLLQDRQKSSHFDIPRLHPSMIESIQDDFRSLEMSRSSGGPFNQSTVEGIMYSQRSPLQLALIDHTINKSIPGPTGWSPTNSHMPYQAFEGHLEWRLAQLGKSLEGLELEMVKLRYVEYLSLVASEAKYFVLGVFTAYGPDLYLYPIRVLQLLKKKHVFRTGTRLYSLIQLPVDGRAYTVLVPMKAPPPNADRSGLLDDHPPFNLQRLQIPGGPHSGPPSFQPPMLMEMNPQYDQPQHFQLDPVHQYPYNEPIHPLNDFPSGYFQGMEGDFRNLYQGPVPGQYMQHPDSQYINPPQPVPPPSHHHNNANNIINHRPIEHQEGPKSTSLPSVLPMEVWKGACERSLTKYGPKYGIGRLSDNDYKVLYDRYLFDTFDNPDDFVRGILTGISLARYPRDDEEPISTSGLLNLPPSHPTPPKPILKPILKAPAQTQPTPQVKPNSVKLSRDDLLRISSLIGQLIPNATDSSSSTVTPRTQLEDSTTRLVDYNHQGNDAEFDPSQYRRPVLKPPVAPSRRNYDEEDMGYEEGGRIIDYDHVGSTGGTNHNSVNQGFFRRLTIGPGSSNSGPMGRGNGMNVNKRPAAAPGDVYEELLQKRRMNMEDPYGYR